jgi:CheY-like chemotaxis protein
MERRERRAHEGATRDGRPAAEREQAVAWILVVDDDWTYRNMLRLILEGRGHVVIEAADGGEGLALYEQHQPDVAIVDMIMPGIEGDEVIAEIRKRGGRVGVIAVSGSGLFYNVDTVQTARKLGADAILRKLDPMERILIEVDRVLKLAQVG